MNISELAASTCRPRSGTAGQLDAAQLAALLELLPGWERHGSAIAKSFAFAAYPATIGFVNAVARIAQEQDHHPAVAFGFDTCRVAYSTHSVGGISLNDLICAAKIEALPPP